MTTSDRPRWRAVLGRCTSIVLGVILFVLVVLILLPFLIGTFGLATLELLATLSFGWMLFTPEMLSLLLRNWAFVTGGFVCVALIGAGVSFLTQRIVAFFATRRGHKTSWSWRWIWCGTLAFVVVLISGFAVTEVIRQMGWVAGDSESFLESRKSEGAHAHAEMVRLNHWLSLYPIKSSEDLDTYRKGYRDAQKVGARQVSAVQEYQILVIMDNETCAGFLIFPRNAQKRKNVGGFVNDDEGSRSVSDKELSEMIGKHQSNLLAL